MRKTVDKIGFRVYDIFNNLRNLKKRGQVDRREVFRERGQGASPVTDGDNRNHCARVSRSRAYARQRAVANT